MSLPASFSFSFERRLIARIFRLYALMLILAAALHLLSAWSSREVESTDQLRDLALGLAAEVKEQGDGRLVLELSAASARHLAAVPELQMALVATDDRRVVEGSADWLVNRLMALPKEWPRAAFTLERDGQPFGGVIETARGPAGTLRIMIVRGEPASEEIFYWVAGEVVLEIIPIMLPLLLLTMIIIAATVRSSLRPLHRLSAEIGGLGSQNSALRLREAGVPEEILPLVRAVNHAFGCIEDTLKQQRRMTANAAHELRTPLAVLQARLDNVLCRSDASQVHLTELQPLSRDISRMARIVDQLLTVARLESGQIEFGDKVDLARTVREVLADFALLAMQDGRKVSLSAPSRPVMIRGNAMALGEALLNLLDNALRYTPPGKDIEVVIETADHDAASVALEVRDCGPGVAEGDRERMFERFWRGSEGFSRGCGLGLAIVRETVLRHQGTVAVHPRSGGGSVFRIELPVTGFGGGQKGNCY